MSMREQFDHVANSIRNGQRRQAFAQMQEIGTSDIPDLLDYFSQELMDQELALDAAKTYFRNVSR